MEILIFKDAVVFISPGKPRVVEIIDSTQHNNLVLKRHMLV